MKALTKTCLLALIITLQPAGDYILAQQTNSQPINSGLNIPTILNFGIHGLQNNMWIIKTLEYDMPRVSFIEIRFETNSRSLGLHIDTGFPKQNLRKGSQEIETSYLLLRNPDEIPHASDPRWGNQPTLWDSVESYIHGEPVYWALCVRLRADSTCSAGIYMNKFAIIMVDQTGEEYSRKIRIQAELIRGGGQEPWRKK